MPTATFRTRPGCSRAACNVADNDLVAASEAAHKLISAASFVGLPTIATEARALHRCCTVRNTRGVRAINTKRQRLNPQGTDALTRHRQELLKSDASGG